MRLTCGRTLSVPRWLMRSPAILVMQHGFEGFACGRSLDPAVAKAYPEIREPRLQARSTNTADDLSLVGEADGKGL